MTDEALKALDDLSGRTYSALQQIVSDKSAPVWDNLKSDIKTIRKVLQDKQVDVEGLKREVSYGLRDGELVTAVDPNYDLTDIEAISWATIDHLHAQGYLSQPQWQPIDQHKFMALLNNVVLQQSQIPSPISSKDIRDICRARTGSILALWEYVSGVPPKEGNDE